MGDNHISSGRPEPGQSAHSILVLYGSETGNSQDLAEEVERLFERLHYDAKAYEMNEVDLVSAPLLRTRLRSRLTKRFCSHNSNNTSWSSL